MCKLFEETRDMTVIYREKLDILDPDFYFEDNRYSILTEHTLYNKKGEPFDIVCPLHEILYVDSLCNQWKTTLPDLIRKVLNDYYDYLDNTTISDLCNLAYQIENLDAETSTITINTFKMFKTMF